jgi:hypothetical protein
MAKALTPLTEAQIEAFTAGDCWALARELGALGVGTPVFLADNVVEKNFADLSWYHVVVQLPSGLYLDATGVVTAEELSKRWDWIAPTINFVPVAAEADFADAVSDQYRYYRHNAKLAARKLQDYVLTA